MTNAASSLISAMLDDLVVRQKPSRIEDLYMREEALSALERDVRFVNFELGRRQNGDLPNFCVDFDVLVEASELSYNNASLSFWSAFLFYVDVRQRVLPPTLYETIKFFKDEADETIGSIGEAFLEAFNKSQVRQNDQ